ncbi:MAG TPA: hypothetical protein VMO26_28915 [Vicinamibacterales bacterium]|nr:hypothetical protein [Vicinamibacterales bacterium]
MKRLLLWLCAALLLASCGKKGNPLPPLLRVPAAPGDFAVTRLDDRVHVRFVVPAVNVDGAGPADVASVEVYALTLDQPPRVLNDLDPDDLREAATLVTATPVRRPLPPMPPDAMDMPPLALPPQGPGVEQGDVVVIREDLTPGVHVVTPLPEQPLPGQPLLEKMDVPRVFSAPASGAGLQRFYFAVAVSPRGRYGPHSAIAPAPLGGTSGPPSAPLITIDETSMTLRWTPPPDARGVVPPADPDVLPSRPIVPGPPPTTYDVYEVPRNAPGDGPLAVPVPLTPEPIGTTEYTQSGITLGRERCFYVRGVDIVDGLHVRGPASPVACASFADTFPPSAPRDLVAVAVAGGVNLIWEPSDARDVAGYLVLRGEAGGDTLTPLMTDPVTTPSYRDESVQAGIRYVYAVVAVDAAGNRSDESNRVEETAQ